MKIKYFNLIEIAMALGIIGFGVTTYHGINSLLRPESAQIPENLLMPIGILGFAFVVEGYVLSIAYKTMKESQGKHTLIHTILYSDNPTTAAVFLEDLIAVIGVLIALSGLWLSRLLQSPIPDAICSILIGALLGLMAIALAFINGRLLIGMSASESKEDDLKEYIEGFPSVEKVMSLKTQILGPSRIKMSAEIEFHGGILLNRKQVEADADRIRQGDEPLPILVDTIERTVRVVGNEINKLENDIQNEFPEIVAISLEVN